MARRVDDPATFLRVAGLLYFCILVPETLDERLTLTAELLVLAADQNDPLLLHFAHRWRLYTAMSAADRDAIDAHLPEMVRYGHACRDPHNAWIAIISQSWRSLLAGQIERAEELAEEGLRFGTETAQGGSGGPEAMACYALHLFEIRGQQDRLAEMQESLASVVKQYPGLPMVRAMLALASVEAGNDAVADELLNVDAADGFAAIPNDPMWF
jgi:predicted Zn-dependent protease